MRIFFAWTPLQILMATAAVRKRPSSFPRILIWTGSRTSGWREVVRELGSWDETVDWSGLGLMGFWEYVRRHTEVFAASSNFLDDILRGNAVSEIAVATEDEYASLALIRTLTRHFGRAVYDCVSLFEDGLALYLRTKHHRPLRHLAKLAISKCLRREVLLPTLRYLAADPHIARIYATAPGLVSPAPGRDVINIVGEFRQVVSEYSGTLREIRPLPSGSGIILSAPLSPLVLSEKEEVRLVKAMVQFLRNECRVKHAYVKYHHYDPQTKRGLFQRCGVEELGYLGTPYEVLHCHLRPQYLVGAVSSALFYSRLIGANADIYAFCSGIARPPGLGAFFASSGIKVM